MQAEVRAPLDAWELEEKRRAGEDKICHLDSYRNTEGLLAAGVYVQITNLENIVVNELYQEREAEAHRVKSEVLSTLKGEYEKLKASEAQQAELEKLRAEAAEREQKERDAQIAREAVEQERKANEQKAALELAKIEQERLAVLQREEQAKRDLELSEQRRIAQEKQAELDKIEAEKRAIAQAEAAKQAEIVRQQAELARVELERLAREADKEHKAKINREALACLVASSGLTEEQAKAVIVAIAKKPSSTR